MKNVSNAFKKSYPVLCCGFGVSHINFTFPQHVINEHEEYRLQLVQVCAGTEQVFDF